MKKVLIFGGTFDPLHNGHIEIAKHVYEQFNFNEVWFLLAKKPRWKRGVSPTNTRLKMLEVGIIDYPFFRVCTHEIYKSSNTTNYTIDTVKELTVTNEQIEFSYLIGLDQLEKLHNWRNIDELAKIISFICVRRPNYSVNEANVKAYNVILLDYEGPDISSTMIKNDFNKKLIPGKVYQYIVDHQLYLEDRIKKYMSFDRYLHSLSMAKLAKKIAKTNHYSPKKAYTAALLHDIAKELDKKLAYDLMMTHYPSLVNLPKETYHQYLGSYLAEVDFNIKDKEILSAISKHCTSATEMSLLDKIIYVSDKIEPTRGYDSKYMIEACLNDINTGYDLVLRENLEYLKQNKVNVYLSEEEKNMNEILKCIVKTIDDKKASNITAIDVSNVNPIVKCYVICDVTNERQNEAVALALEKALLDIDYPIRRIEGRNGDRKWILVDANDFVVHIFDANERARYKLEVLWGDQPRYDITEMIQ